MTPSLSIVVAEVFLDARDAPLLAALVALAPRARCAQVHLIHVVEAGRAWPGRTVPTPPRPPALDLLVAELSALLPEVRTVGVHRSGRSMDEIARLAGEVRAELLVVRRSALPETAGWAEHGQRLLRLADCSVLVVPDGASVAFAHAAVGMDFSENARLAVDLARSLVDRVTVVAVIDPTHERGGGEVEASIRETWRQQNPGDGAPSLVVVAARSPAEALASVPDVDLLVCGSRGLTPLAAVLLGSTAERLGAVCSGLLLVVRRPGDHQGLFQSLFRVG